ncbi:LAFE_0F03356g1_1 [Lachancea fermentati]|uniref:LAFE_0F03356g1_1 n=1 Tax=Lachancea fermentati TaxID=4955 RepID=A0A1G4MEX9_LACFM|nr:LAFE_0F03356g1_1 [Lachancea fermentati]
MVEWCAIVYDKKGSDRSQERPAHLAGIPPLVEQGKLVCAGAIYHDVVDGKPTNFAGSHLQIVADTKEEALEVIKNDVFAKKGIWDLDSILIFPFGCAVRKEKK